MNCESKEISIDNSIVLKKYKLYYKWIIHNSTCDRQISIYLFSTNMDNDVSKKDLLWKHEVIQLKLHTASSEYFKKCGKWEKSYLYGK